MTRLIGRALASTLLISAAVLAAAVAAFLIAVQLAGTKPVIDAISCELNASHECLRNDLRKERRKLDHERQKRLEEERKRGVLEERVAELKRIEQRAKKLQIVHDRLKQISHAASSFVIFHSSKSGRYRVETGHKYASLLKPDMLIQGWCQLFPGNRRGVSRFIEIAGFEKDRRIKNYSIGRSTLRETGLSKRDIKAAQKRCVWPPGVS